jgi:hypothetical protein
LAKPVKDVAVATNRGRRHPGGEDILDESRPPRDRRARPRAERRPAPRRPPGGPGCDAEMPTQLQVLANSERREHIIALRDPAPAPTGSLPGVCEMRWPRNTIRPLGSCASRLMLRRARSFPPGSARPLSRSRRTSERINSPCSARPVADRLHCGPRPRSPRSSAARSPGPRRDRPSTSIDRQ